MTTMRIHICKVIRSCEWLDMRDTTHSYWVFQSTMCTHIFKVIRLYEWLNLWDSTNSYELAHMNSWSHIWISLICVTPLIHMRYWYVLSFFLSTLCTQPCVFKVIRWYIGQEAFACMTELVHICDMTDSYVRHDWLICVTWLIYACGMTHAIAAFQILSHIFYHSVWSESLMRNITWLTHSNITCRDTRILAAFQTITCILPLCVTWIVDAQDETTNAFKHICHDSCMRGFSDPIAHVFWYYAWPSSFTRMGWLRWVGCLKI